MRKLTTKLFLAFSATFIMGVALHAQSYQGNATIPFAFELHGQTIPAGTYAVEQNIKSVTTLRNQATSRAVFIQTTGTDEGKGAARLVFHRYGERYFLAEIWSPTQRGTVLHPSRAEKELISSGVREEAAVIAVNPQVKAD
jgi:hypothetical protein